MRTRRIHAGAIRSLAAYRQVRVRINDETQGSDNMVLLRSGLVLRDPRPIVLWSHDPAAPIARTIAVVDGAQNATEAIVGFPPEGTSELSDQIYGLIRTDVINAVSTGFVVNQSEMRGAIRYATRWTLYELSFVSIPALASALVLERAGKTISAATHERLGGHLDRIVAECVAARGFIDDYSGEYVDDDGNACDPADVDEDGMCPTEARAARADKARRQRDVVLLRLRAIDHDDAVAADGRERRRLETERLRRGAA